MSIFNKENDGRIRVVWTGNAGWLISYGGKLFSVDLDLEPMPFCPYRIAPPPFTPEEVAPFVDLALYTHNHGDHFNTYTAEKLVNDGGCTFVAPATCVEMEIPEKRRITPHPSENFEFEGVKIAPIRALHGHKFGSVYKLANLDDCGYIFDFGNKRLMIPGDTVLLHDHEEVGKVDILMVSPTEHNTWIDHTVTLIEQTSPEYIFPQHYGTYEERPDIYFWTHGYVDELREALPEGTRSKYHVLKPGEEFII